MATANLHGGLLFNSEERMKDNSGSFSVANIAAVLAVVVFLYLFMNNGLLIKVEYKGDPQILVDTTDFIERIETLFESHDHKKDVISKRPTLISEPPKLEDAPYITLYEAIERWNPDEVKIPYTFEETIQNFNFGDPYERSIAEKYREAEIPFKLHNVSEVDSVTQKWTDDYLLEKLKKAGKIEKSINNHFMFWKYGQTKNFPGFIPPTEIVKWDEMNFQQWLELSRKSTEGKLSPTDPHYYYILMSGKKELKNNFLGSDLPFFNTEKENFFINNVEEMGSIDCRFGMSGVIAESHFDSGRNMVAMFRGNKRYILSPPQECKYFALITDNRHPSYRQSVIDWSDLQQAKSHYFDKVRAIDTVVHEGEVLYIPAYWFHYVISLDYSIQCNARCGDFDSSMEGRNEVMHKCLGLPEKNKEGKKNGPKGAPKNAPNGRGKDGGGRDGGGRDGGRGREGGRGEGREGGGGRDGRGPKGDGGDGPRKKMKPSPDERMQFK